MDSRLKSLSGKPATGRVGLFFDIFGVADMAFGWFGMTNLQLVAFTVGTTLIAMWTWANWDRLLERPSRVLDWLPRRITWDKIKDNSYTCPDVACLLYGYAPSAKAKALDEVRAWMDRLNEQMNFQLNTPIDNATRQALEKWMLPIYGACQGGEGDTPDLYNLYLGRIESMKLKRAWNRAFS